MISVITVNRNTGTDVERTIRSVLTQDTPFEWVVVDGASTDSSVGVLRTSIRPGDRMVSEPDRGIADAFNKSLRMATGDAVIFMNAGDEFAGPGALRALVQQWNRSSSRWITGTAEVVKPDGTILFTRRTAPPLDTRELVRRGCRVFHQATLVDRELLLEMGGFDGNYRTSMDYDLWIRLMVAGHLPQVSDVVVCRYRTGGVSGAVLARFREERRSRAAHGMANPAWLDLRLATIARLKGLAGGWVGPWAYRLKERMGW